MQGYQFGHVETWSIAGSTGSIHHESGARKNGQRAWTVEQIFDEAERIPGSALHVDRMAEGPQVIPGAVASFADLRAAHAAAAAVKEAFGYTGKDGAKSTRSRKLRKDARSLFTAVFSLPVDAAEARRDPMLRERCLAVLEEAIARERERLEALGGTFLMAVVHWDEAKVHAHVFAVDRERGRVNALHPGVAAKETFMGDPGHRRLLTKKDLNRGGDRAYKAAMRAWQDDLHEAVFAPAGLLRVGPRRERLPRADYARAKRAASERQEDRERQEEIAKETADLLAFNRSMLDLMGEDAAQQRAWNDAAEERSRQLVAFEDQLLETRRDVERERDDLARREAQVQVREAVIASREARVSEREKKATRREVQAELKARDLDARECEVDASLAAIEAVVDGIADVIKSGGKTELQRNAQAEKTVWSALVQRMSRAPESARKMAGRVWQRLAKLRSRAAEEGRETARREARAELRESFDRVQTAWSATVAMRKAVTGILEQLPAGLRANLEREAEHETTRAATTYALARRAAGDIERS